MTKITNTMTLTVNENKEIVSEEITTDELTTSDMDTLVSIDQHLENIDKGVSVICVVLILTVVWLGAWTVVSKWFFGGVGF